jgi:Tol biopolymer transport system component
MTMADLKTRFRGADWIPAPHLWEEITNRVPTGAPSEPGPVRRILVAVFALAVATAAVTFAVRAIGDGGSRPASEEPIPSIEPKANGLIYYQLGGGDGGTWTEAIKPDGSGRTTIFGRDRYVSHIAWSPDGTKIAYVGIVQYGSQSSDGQVHFGIFVANPDGTGATPLTDGVNEGWPSWSPDGTQIAFSSSRADPTARECASGTQSSCATDIYLMNVDGSAIRRLTDDPAPEYAPAWSPDGSKIAFVRTNGDTNQIDVMNPDGTGITRVASGTIAGLGGVEHPFSWSPDGSQIVFMNVVGANSEIHIVNADGTGDRTIFGADGVVSEDPIWSPDGTEIAFSSTFGVYPPGCGVDSDVCSDLFVMGIDGSHVTRLTHGASGVFGIAWQPLPLRTPNPTPTQTTTSAAPLPASMGLIAFGCGYHICTMSPDGTNITDLTKSDDPSIVLAAYDPVWSPDGTKIAFVGYPRGAVRGGANYDVYAMNADGSAVTNLTTSPADVASWFSQLDPKWSPDGTKIVYDGDDGLYVMNADGSDQTRVAAGQDASWSPDGTRIAFEGAGGAIWSVAPDGSGLLQLTGGVGFDGFPAYSPDGTKIAYYHGQGSDRAIVVKNADGSDQTRVADFQADTMGRPVWSPDGSRLAFDLYFTDQTWDIYVVNADGTELADVANDPNMDENDPVWSPDGSTIAFQASHVLARDIDNTGTFDIYVMTPDGTDQIALTHDLGTSGGSDMYWQRLGMDPTGAPGSPDGSGP